MTGWEQVLDDLVRTRRRALTAYAYLLCQDLREAEDLVQDALVAVFSRGRRLENVMAGESYVRKAILNTYLDGFRRRNRWAAVRHLVATAPEQPVSDVATTDHVAVRVDAQRALSILAPRERACVILRFYDDLTIPQIAEHLSLSTGTVKRYLHDAVSRLEAVLGPLPAAHLEDLDVLMTGGSR